MNQSEKLVRLYCYCGDGLLVHCFWYECASNILIKICLNGIQKSIAFSAVEKAQHLWTLLTSPNVNKLIRLTNIPQDFAFDMLLDGCQVS